MPEDIYMYTTKFLPKQTPTFQLAALNQIYHQHQHRLSTVVTFT